MKNFLTTLSTPPLPLKMYEPQLARFAWLMLLLMLPTANLLFWDARTWHDAAIWAKPLKFMAATALFAATTSWLTGLLPQVIRLSKRLNILVWMLIITALFEVGYITLQAGLGQGSHYYVSDPLHAALYNLMAIAATMLTATQAWLAWLIFRHSATRDSLFTLAAIVGLGLTFVLATFSGFLLGGQQPPAGVGLPVVGWHINAADARPAHFLGLHAQQFILFFGWVLQQSGVRFGRLWLLVLAITYVAGWAALMYSAATAGV